MALLVGSKKRILITGGGGFVAPYVVLALRKVFGSDAELLLTSLSGARQVHGIGVEPLDVTSGSAVEDIVAQFAPTHLIHLAGISDISAAAAKPGQAWQVNLMGTLHCAWALLRHAPDAMLVFAGSSQIYGLAATSGRSLTELDLPQPTSDYGATKAAADLALGALAAKGLRCVRFRPFNHTGPGQTEAFAIPSFAAQIARIEQGSQEPVIHVGNLEAKRDFLDVRDIADAYARAVAVSETLSPGVIFNLASGKPVSMQSVLDTLISYSSAEIRVEIDRTRWRENDIPVLAGDASRARRELDWIPRHDLDQTLRDVLEDQRLLTRQKP
jgi:GDP-4-dehydro-6-deoxy-D-mannose reductase